MAPAGFLKSVYLRYFAKPVADRTLFRLIARHRLTHIVELGVGDGLRAQRMIALALRNSRGLVRYTGVDQFEARPAAQPGLTLKQAYQRLRPSGAKVQLAPGDPFSALGRIANSHAGTELFIVSADQDADALAKAWFFVPRMLASGAFVLVARPSDSKAGFAFETLSATAVSQLA
ncbi:MAG: hypothetical protein KDA41_19510, partial [Planctomycetales bacterium]|nr:hypothetical protein [Planctomycetales bacterium]